MTKTVGKFKYILFIFAVIMLLSAFISVVAKVDFTSVLCLLNTIIVVDVFVTVALQQYSILGIIEILTKDSKNG